MNQQITKNNKVLEQIKIDNLPAQLKNQFPIFVSKAKNSTLWDVEGNEYIDFTGGIATLNVGHSHEKVIEKVKEQMELFSHTCFAVIPYENYVTLAAKMNMLVPGDFKKKTFFINSGAEAVENAIKVARYNTKRSAVMVFNGSFHGRTNTGMTLTGKVNPYKMKFRTTTNDIYHLPFPAPELDLSVADCLKFMKGIFKSAISPTEVAAILIEPVQGEGGFYQAPIEFMKAIRKICDENGILLIADEVQSGFGRTGKFFAMEHYKDNGKQINADIVTFAKSIAAGLPLSGITARAELLDAIHTGGLGTTFGGNPVAISAAHAVIDIIFEEKLLSRSQRLGDKLVSFLNGLKGKQKLISSVRGLGSMVAVEFNDPTGKQNIEDFVNSVQTKAFKDGLLLLVCGINNNVIRFLYPLTIEDELFDKACMILEKAIV